MILLMVNVVNIVNNIDHVRRISLVGDAVVE